MTEPRLKLLPATAVLALALCGCAAPKAKLDTPFDATYAAELMKPGANTLKGSALLRQRGGSVVTCAGREVTLIPATDYAKQRLAMIYGSSSLATTIPTFEHTPPRYTMLVRKTTCNAQGLFSFDSVANGDFFVVTVVAWEVGYSQQGGALMQRVSVAGGETKEIVLTAN